MYIYHSSLSLSLSLSLTHTYIEVCFSLKMIWSRLKQRDLERPPRTYIHTLIDSIVSTSRFPNWPSQKRIYLFDGGGLCGALQHIIIIIIIIIIKE